MQSLIIKFIEYLHCKNESVYCTLNCPNTHTKIKQCVYWDKMVCSKHFHSYSVGHVTSGLLPSLKHVSRSGSDRF